MKAATQAPLVAGGAMASGSQSSGLGVGGMGSRGLLLGSLNPHMESFRGATGMRVSECSQFRGSRELHCHKLGCQSPLVLSEVIHGKG